MALHEPHSDPCHLWWFWVCKQQKSCHNTQLFAVSKNQYHCLHQCAGQALDYVYQQEDAAPTTWPRSDCLRIFTIMSSLICVLLTLLNFYIQGIVKKETNQQQNNIKVSIAHIVAKVNETPDLGINDFYIDLFSILKVVLLNKFSIFLNWTLLNISFTF